jgi:hypothetical protein
MVVRLGRGHIVVKRYDTSLDVLSEYWRAIPMLALKDAADNSCIQGVSVV